MRSFWGGHIISYAMSIWVAAAWMIAALPQRAAADEAVAAYAVELVSLIRQDPLSYAEAMGYERYSLLGSLSWLENELSLGVPALVTSDFLNQSAAAGNSENGTQPEAEYSTSFARTGEIAGTVSFSNFMDPYTAVQIVVNNQFAQELSAGYSGQRCILNRELDMAGASFEAATINGANAYSLTISLGSSLLKTDRQVLNQINQLRSNPTGAGWILNMDLSGYTGVYPPLFNNDLLRTFATTPYAADPDFRIHVQNYGYTGYGVGKLSALTDFPKSDLNTVAFWMFSALVVNEIKGLGNGKTILGSYLNDIGMNLAFMSGETWDHASLSVIAGLSADTVKSKDRIYGLIFNDWDQNGFYTPGEGRPGKVVQVYRTDTWALAAVVLTDNTGHFQVDLDPGIPYVVLTASGEAYAYGTLVLTGDQFFSLVVAD